MARVLSTPTTITITGGSSPTILKQAAAATASDSFRTFTGALLDTTADAAAQFNAGGLSYRTAHYYTGTLVGPFEDGQAAAGDLSGGPGGAGNKTCVDWCGKGVYDPTGRKAMVAGTGAFGSVASTPINTRSVYDEATATWAVERGFRTSDENDATDGSGHTYDGNCIDVSGRRFFKKKFARSIYIKDLTTGFSQGGSVGWTKVSYSSGEPSGYGWDAGLEWIPARSRLWIRSIHSADNSAALHELNATTGAITTLYSGGTIGASSPSVCSLNPRAHGDGQGAVFIGGSSGYIVRVSNLALTASSGKPAAAGGILWATGAHLCRDPSVTGTGWLYACTDGFMYSISLTGVWTQRAQLPLAIRNDYTNNGRMDIAMIPIDAEGSDYGVVWIIGGQYLGTSRAWLYKP